MANFNATVVKSGNTRGSKFIQQAFTDSLAAVGGTGNYNVNVPVRNGLIRFIGLDSASTNLDVKIYDNEAMTDDFLVYDAIFNGTDSDQTVSSPFMLDTDKNPKLFAKLTNNDGTNATGDINIRLRIKEV